MDSADIGTDIGTDLLEQFEVREATNAEIYSLLEDFSLRCKITLPGALDTLGFKHTPYVIKLDPYIMLFNLWEVKGGLYQIHIICPRAHTKGSRALALAAMTWAFSREELGVKALLTMCPEGKIANMVRKLGFRKIKQLEDQCYFIINKDTD